jgi:predicted nucleic acid-binding protein
MLLNYSALLNPDSINLRLRGLAQHAVLRAYLDLCCFRRKFDDQLHPQVERETYAVTAILNSVMAKQIELAWSYVLTEENSFIPSEFIKNYVANWGNYAVVNVNKSDTVNNIAQLIQLTGVEKYDALHVAAAKIARCHLFVTTDKRLLKYKDPHIILCNPVDLLTML